MLGLMTQCFGELQFISAAELRTFLFENPDKFCRTLDLIIQKNHGGIDTNRCDGYIVALVRKLLEDKFTTDTQHEKELTTFKIL